MRYSEEEKIVANASYEEKKSFNREGHDLHMMRITIHSLCVQASGEEWNRFRHKCPVKLFDKEIEELINKAVAISNWAAIELYDPIDNYGGY